MLNKIFNPNFTTGLVRLLIPSLFFILACVFFLFPLASFLREILDENSIQFLTSPQIRTATVNSMMVSLVGACLSLLVAVMAASLLIRLKTKYQVIFAFLLTWPMLLPSLSHGMGLIILFGNNSWIARVLSLDIHIYGFFGILMGSLLYALPVGFLMIFDILKYEDRTKYAAAEILGIPKYSQFLRLELPYLKKPLIGVFFALFCLILTDYGVPLMVGGRYQTLPVLMYTETIGLLNYNKGAVIGLILLIPAVVAFLIDIKTGKDLERSDKNNTKLTIYRGKIKVLAIALLSTISAYCLLPSFVFLFTSFVKKYPVDLTFSLENLYSTLDAGGLEYLINSLEIAFATSLIGVVFTTILAFYTSNTRGLCSRSLHFISLLSLAVPGLVLGLAYTLFFEASFLYGTLAILIFVNLAHFCASPYLMIYNFFEKVGQELEAVTRTLGIPKFRFFADILIPMSLRTQIEMFVYFFVNSMVTISAVAFLSTVDNRPVSLMITQFEAQMQIENAAIVSLLILSVNLILKLSSTFFKKYVTRT